jgi:hypothetical protein
MKSALFHAVNDPGFTRHNCIDELSRTGEIAHQTTFSVYCPVENFRVESVNGWTSLADGEIGGRGTL